MKSENLLSQFDYSTLPKRLHPVAFPFGKLAHAIFEDLPHNQETIKCIRALGKAKEAAIRSALTAKKFAEPVQEPETVQDQDAD